MTAVLIAWLTVVATFLTLWLIDWLLLLTQLETLLTKVLNAPLPLLDELPLEDTIEAGPVLGAPDVIWSPFSP